MATPTALDTELIPQVLELVNAYGKTITFTIPTQDRQYNPLTGVAVSNDPTDFDRKVTPPEGYAVRYVNGDSIQSGDLSCYLPASDLPFTPVIGLIARFDDERWEIVDVGKIYTGEQIALYSLQMRK